MNSLKLLVFLTLFVNFAFAETLLVKPKASYRVQILSSHMESFSVKRKVIGDVVIVDGDYAKLSKDSRFEYVERNQRYHIVGSTEPTAPVPWDHNWGLEKTEVKKMWAKGFEGNGIRVAVIDTGVDGTHQELNGKVQPGYNAIDDSDNAMDDHGHGTHCSGVIAGNAIGMAPKAQIIPIKFLDKEGSGSLEGALKAIDWATKHDVQVMSNSWGGGSFSQALYDAIKAAGDKGIWFTAAAGNEYNDNDRSKSYPASYDLPNIIAVAAVDVKDGKAGFSNWGKKSVLLGAPGVDIYSSVLGGKYAVWSGTSMATPHVSGAVALLLEAKCSDMVACLKKEVRELPALKNKVITDGALDFK